MPSFVGLVLAMVGLVVFPAGEAAFLMTGPRTLSTLQPTVKAASWAERKQVRGDGLNDEPKLLGQWARATLAAAAVLAAVVAGGARTAHAESPAAGNINIFFGQGCFWHVQHEVVKKEFSALGRKAMDVSALSGYAGGTKAGDGGAVCYHNGAGAPDYGQLGHTEVVNVSIPEDQVNAFAKNYFDAAASYPFGRADPQDMGTEYRSAIGLPGGMDSPLFKQVEEANAGRMQLLRGQGNDSDTVGTKKVWIYDSNKFPFYQGEVYHQFHDDMGERYSQSYHQLKGVMLDKGTLKKVTCPDRI
mmetsp:Transcript_3628/g.7107  ORF Transcript_3628/g.7107 Transcript_3628/m.7107 type:complete len:301 (-) Transcript_3628:26-928(-)